MAGTTTMRPREPDDDRAGTDGADGKRADDAIRAQVDAIDALLPQTQCTRCGFAGCRPYAASVATGGALNRCPPGGARTIRALAGLLGRSAPPLDPACGSEAPPALARIDPEACIGCTLCIEACPVDAIVGTARRLHVVLAERCNGCGLCVAPCPVDCIAMPPRPADAGPGPGADANRRHVLARGARRTRLQQGQRERLEALGWPARVECRVAGDGGATLTSCAPAPGEGTAGLPEAVAAALARARARRRAAGPAPHA